MPTMSKQELLRKIQELDDEISKTESRSEEVNQELERLRLEDEERERERQREQDEDKQVQDAQEQAETGGAEEAADGADTTGDGVARRKRAESTDGAGDVEETVAARTRRRLTLVAQQVKQKENRAKQAASRRIRAAGKMAGPEDEQAEESERTTLKRRAFGNLNSFIQSIYAQNRSRLEALYRDDLERLFPAQYALTLVNKKLAKDKAGSTSVAPAASGLKSEAPLDGAISSAVPDASAPTASSIGMLLRVLHDVCGG